jgi:GNAT superfamily N-acetyltransferase
MKIRPAVPADIPIIAELIRALADYERLAHEVALNEDALHAHLFGAHPYAEVLLAEDEEARAPADKGARAPSPATRASSASSRVVGFALFFHTYSTFLGKPGIWLEDLFVRPEHRGRGYGRALLAELAQIAVERGCARLEWSVLDWNESSINFYRALGAAPMDEWTTYRLTGDALDDLARGVSPTSNI